MGRLQKKKTGKKKKKPISAKGVVPERKAKTGNKKPLAVKSAPAENKKQPAIANQCPRHIASADNSSVSPSCPVPLIDLVSHAALPLSTMSPTGVRLISDRRCL